MQMTAKGLFFADSQQFNQSDYCRSPGYEAEGQCVKNCFPAASPEWETAFFLLFFHGGFPLFFGE
ncbi:hypothetical protein [Victivallis vadensis]|uniref:hypothetical protein n=1 Tax=Victivallis vadensis TaxID=172901 RepID=UPI00307E7E28